MFNIKNKNLVFTGIVFLIMLVIAWRYYVPRDETQIIDAGVEKVYNITPCRVLKLNIQRIASMMKGNGIIEVRAGKEYHYIPYRSDQLIYNLDSSMIAGEGTHDKFQGFEKGHHYIICIRVNDSNVMWSSQIHVAESLLARIYYFPVGTGFPLGTLLLIAIVLSIIIYPFYNSISRRK